ncbi:hypothetical protein CDAR_273081 [Caerostris darwini]|uniref:Uncharacterized protein n=1 Tax=Caerostris darwini TaxID=1538125 RepID=A0AAV4MGT4_9ARAC|nr:hypothetical protein CDAR_273081 [Caerostris darwini]
MLKPCSFLVTYFIITRFDCITAVLLNRGCLCANSPSIIVVFFKLLIFSSSTPQIRLMQFSISLHFYDAQFLHVSMSFYADNIMDRFGRKSCISGKETSKIINDEQTRFWVIELLMKMIKVGVLSLECNKLGASIRALHWYNNKYKLLFTPS